MILTILFNLFLMLIFFVVNIFILFIPINIKFLFGIITFLLICNIILQAIRYFSSKGKIIKEQIQSKILCIIFLVLFIGLLAVKFVTTSSIINYEKYRALAGEIETKDFTEDMETIDLNNLPIINLDLASNLADKKLGEITSLGSMATVGELTLQEINGELYYVAPLEHSGFFKWSKNKSGTTGYIKVNATKENDVQLITEVNGKELNLKYLSSAYFGSNLERYAYNQYSKNGLTDYSFEVDNEGNPYWIISIYDKTIGLSGEKVIGTLIIDPQTGESTEYSIDETPEWVDRIQSIDIVEENLNDWGELVHGVFNFSGQDQLTLTEGISIIYNEGICYYYTGVTSVGSDESLVGFFLTNSKTGETTMYKTSGAIETAGQKSAEGKVQQYSYEATFPILINTQNQPTYFMTLLDSKGLIKNYAFVNVKNYNIVGVGETIQQAYNNYIEGLSRDSSSALTNSSELTSIKGTIERIGMYISNGSTYYMINVSGSDINFIVPTELESTVCIAKEGDKVELSYIANTTGNITVQKYINNTK